MEQQKLPNVTLALVLSILGFVCCCFAGLPGIILGGIALFLANKDEKMYMQNPENYSNYSTLKTTKIVSIIVLVLGIIYLAYSIYGIMQIGGWDAYIEQVKTMTEQYQ
ncbi:MAG: CCC motif membrane protein [Maribacter sp.]